MIYQTMRPLMTWSDLSTSFQLLWVTVCHYNSTVVAQCKFEINLIIRHDSTINLQNLKQISQKLMKLRAVIWARRKLPVSSKLCNTAHNCYCRKSHVAHQMIWSRMT